MALKSGFYNAVEVEPNVFDRVYSADEYTNFYSAFLKDGVRRSSLNDLNCTASGLVVTIGAGYAICGSKWIHNDTAESLPAITPPTGQYSRIDGVFLHVDVNESTRAASFVYRTGTPAQTPTPPEKNTDSGIFELCLCYVLVSPNTTSVSITDKRADSTVCGWVTSPVGYDDYFDLFESTFNTFMTNSQVAFETWFADLRETLAVTTLYKQYTQYIKTTAASTSTATITIQQYDPTGVDILQVYCNGMLLIENIDYTVNDTTITFTTAKIANTEILIVVYKSIDGAGLGSVSDEVTQLQNDVAAMQNEFVYESFDFNSSLTIQSKTVGSYVQTVTKTGYTAIGIIQINATTGLIDTSLDITLYNFGVSTVNGVSTINVDYYNSASSARTITGLQVTVLYKKNAS